MYKFGGVVIFVWSYEIIWIKAPRAGLVSLVALGGAWRDEILLRFRIINNEDNLDQCIYSRFQLLFGSDILKEYHVT